MCEPRKRIKPLTGDQMEKQLIDTSWGGGFTLNGEIETVEFLPGNKVLCAIITIKPGPLTSTYTIDIEKVEEHPTVNTPLPTQPLETKETDND